MKPKINLPNFFCVEHPLIQHKLTLMREIQCTPHAFRTMLHEISLLMGYEVSRSLKMTERVIRTPLSEMLAPTLDEPAPCIVPVLRAGLGMSDGLVELIPTAQVGHVGVYRDHDTKKPVEYLVRLPENVGQMHFIVDPMLATGNSLVHTCDVLVKHGVAPEKIRVMTLVAAPEGVQAFHAVYPSIPVYSAALDERLDKNAYIVPGLGDAGDRIFGTA